MIASPGRYLSDRLRQIASPMGHIYELTGSSFVPRAGCRARPGPVRGLRAVATFRGHLVLEWRSPAGAAAAFYRVERTREGHNYETLIETQSTWVCLKDAPPKEPWFYRITGVNARGAGKARKVYLFQRFGNGRSRLLPIPVRPGVRVNIYELVPAIQR